LFFFLHYNTVNCKRSTLTISSQIGSRSFNRKSLHHIGDGLNPYEQAITIIGKTLAAFDEDNLIPCYGFGDGILIINYIHNSVNLSS